MALPRHRATRRIQLTARLQIFASIFASFNFTIANNKNNHSNYICKNTAPPKLLTLFYKVLFTRILFTGSSTLDVVSCNPWSTSRTAQARLDPTALTLLEPGTDSALQVTWRPHASVCPKILIPKYSIFLQFIKLLNKVSGLKFFCCKFNCFVWNWRLWHVIVYCKQALWNGDLWNKCCTEEQIFLMNMTKYNLQYLTMLYCDVMYRAYTCNSIVGQY